MSDIMYGIQPQDWQRQQRTLTNDECEMIRIKYIGSQAAAHISTAVTTGIIKFEQGADTTAAVVGTGTNPGTAGLLDPEDFTDLKAIMTEINKTGDWISWLVDCPPDLSPSFTTNECAYITNETDRDCTVSGGQALYWDTSLETNEIHYCGITLNGDPALAGADDRQVLHEILSITADIDWGTSFTSCLIYEYDDIAGTKKKIGAITLIDGTETTHSNSGEPLYATKGKRWGLVALGAGLFTGAILRVSARSFRFGPSVRESKLWSTLETNV